MVSGKCRDSNSELGNLRSLLPQIPACSLNIDLALVTGLCDGVAALEVPGHARTALSLEAFQVH